MPPYSLQYHFEFFEAYSDRLGYVPARFRVEFARRDFGGAATEILPGGDPVVIKWTDNDDVFTPILPSEATFSLAAQDYWNVKGFYVTDDRELRVRILIDTTGAGLTYEPFWTGWVRATNLTEAYQSKPYPVTVTAADGLISLADSPLLTPSGKRLAGQVSVSTVVRTALLQTGHELPLLTAANIFEGGLVAVGQTTDGKASQNLDPLHQTQLLAEALSSDDGETYDSEESIKRVLSPFGVRLCQTAGAWSAFRTAELAGGFDVWNPAGNTLRIRPYENPLAPPDSPPSSVSRSVDVSVLVSRTGTVRASEGSHYAQGTAPAVQVEQHFGRYLNQLPNGDFGLFDPATGFPTGWYKGNVPASGPLRPHVVGTGTAIDPYGLFIFGASDEKFNRDTPFVARRMIYPPGSFEISRQMVRVLKGRFKTQNVRGAKIVVVALRISGNRPPEVHLLKAGGEWVKNPKPKESDAILIDHTLTNASGRLIAKPGYADVNLPMNAIDGIVQLTIFLCAGEALDKFDPVTGGYVGANTGPPTPFVVYENMRLEAKLAGVSIDGQTRRREKPGKRAKTDLTLHFGDVPDPARPYSRVGTFYTRQAGRFASGPFYKGDQVFTGGPGAPIGNSLIGYRTADLARQTMLPAETFEGTLLGRLPYGPHTLLKFADLGVTVDSLGPENGLFIAHSFVITGLSYSLRFCSNQLTAVQLMGDKNPLPAAVKAGADWQTPEGAVPIETGTGTDLPIDPTLPQSPVSLEDRIQSGISRRIGAESLGLSAVRTGFTPVDTGENYLVATVTRNGLVTGIVRSRLRQLIDFSFADPV